MYRKVVGEETRRDPCAVENPSAVMCYLHKVLSIRTVPKNFRSEHTLLLLIESTTSLKQKSCLRGLDIESTRLKVKVLNILVYI